MAARLQISNIIRLLQDIDGYLWGTEHISSLRVDVSIKFALVGVYTEWENRGDQPRTEKQR